MNRSDAPELSIRGYEPGDEHRIVDFLNLCYQTSSNDTVSWRWSHSDSPTFVSDNEFIVESGGELVSYRAMYLRDILIHGSRVTTASLGATATHPASRGRGIYSRLHRLTLERATEHNATLALTWNSIGSTTYRNNLKTGFVVVRQHTYIKIINQRKVLEVELRKLFKGNSRIGSLLAEVKQDLHIEMDNQIMSVAEMVDGCACRSSTDSRKIVIRIAKDAVPLLLMVKKNGALRRLNSALKLVFSGKVRLSCRSPLAMIRFLRLGVRVVFK